MDWKQILDAVDEDYLIGISNKGIVKRAYKDKEESTETTLVEESGSQLTVTVGGETVKISYPLGDSKCSCPSRSICRHVVWGILLAKEQFEKTNIATEAQEDVISGTADVATMEKQEELVRDVGSEKDITEEVAMQSSVMEEIKAYPLKPLLRALGNKALRTLVERMQSQVCPQIRQTSIVTVMLPEQAAVVKLLAPLEYSTCTCHKKGLCVHKAEAILWCQWQEKVITTQMLAGEAEQTPEYDRETIRRTCTQIRDYLEEMLDMGLCRTSIEVVTTLERLAILAHNAELPRLENNLRALADTYDRYLKRSAHFMIEDVVRKLCRLYGQVKPLLTAETNSEIARVAGEFRAEYKTIGDLDLIGITWEHFNSQSGYEGDTIYFLEENTQKWYTYTNARPTFYEAKNRSGYTQKASAPWGLTIPLEGMVNMRIHLQNAKCDASSRLSSSQETKGEIVGSRVLTQELLKGWYYEDFGVAFREQITEEMAENNSPTQEKEKLVFLKPTEIEQAVFDEVEQVLHMPLWDEKGKKILIEVPYSKKEDATIRYLERWKEGKVPCFVGRLYLKGSRLQMYPLDLFTQKELPWNERNLFERLLSKPEKIDDVDSAPQEAVANVLREVKAVLEDLYQVGFDSVQDAVLHSLKEVKELAEVYGMEYLKKQLSILAEQIDRERHQLTKTEDGTEKDRICLYIELCNYVFVGYKKVMYDTAKNYYEA